MRFPTQWLAMTLLIGFAAACGDDDDDAPGDGDADADADADGDADADADADTDADADGDGQRIEDAALPLDLDYPVQFVAGQPFAGQVTFDLPADLEAGELRHVSFDLGASLPSVQITRTDGGVNPAEPRIDLRLGLCAGQTLGECDEVELTAVLTADAAFVPQGIEPTRIELPQQALDLIASGSFTVRLEGTSTVDATATLTGLVGSLEVGATCAAPDELAGRYSGTYACDNTTGEESGDVGLTVLQAGHTGLYFDDGDAFYLGAVCGDRFTFFGGTKHYFEWGSLTATETAGSKESTWVSKLDPGIGGTCADDLARQ